MFGINKLYIEHFPPFQTRCCHLVTLKKSVNMASNVIKLHASVKDFPGRGGASIVEVNGKILIFGGADREQTAFQDLTVYHSSAESHFMVMKTTGDIPMQRSGHAVASYGKYMFLFGGIDFAEEAVFNELYILNTDTFEWGYVGESGVEVIARNSHSLAIIRDNAPEPKHYLVVYGGASPEHGPLGDTIYAVLPPVENVDFEKIVVDWKLLSTATATRPNSAVHHTKPAAVNPVAAEATSSIIDVNFSGTDAPNTSFTASAEVHRSIPSIPTPSAREMHATCTYNGSMYILGGRNASDEVLSDVWKFSATVEVDPSAEQEEPVDHWESVKVEPKVGFAWTRRVELQLTVPRCAHGAVITCVTDARNTHQTTVPRPVSAHAASRPATATMPPAGELPLPNTTTTSETETETESLRALEHSVHIVVFGGFTPHGVSRDMLVMPLFIDAEITDHRRQPTWQGYVQSTQIPGRFGLALCPLSIELVLNITSNKRYRPFVTPAAAQCIANKSSLLKGKGLDEHRSVVSVHAGFMLFGGVSLEQDYCDIYLMVL